MSRSGAERQARLDYIFESACRLFDARGLENCSMEDIAAAAEYTRRTLYTYFKSRDELYLCINMENLRLRRARQREAMAEAGSGLARILAWADEFISCSRENPQALRMEVYWDFYGVDPERISPEVFSEFEALNDELAAELIDLFRDGIADGTLRADLDPDMAVSQFLYSLRSVTNRALSSSYTFAAFDSGEYLRHFFELLRRGIGSGGAVS